MIFEIETGWTSESTQAFSTELYCLLVETTTGEAATRVASITSEEGFAAYQAVHKWFRDTSSLATTERSRALMKLSPAKEEEEVRRQ